MICGADHQKFVFLDTGLPSHPLMDDEGSQSKLDPKILGEKEALPETKRWLGATHTLTRTRYWSTRLQAHLNTRKARTVLMDYFSNPCCYHKKQHRTLPKFSRGPTGLDPRVFLKHWLGDVTIAKFSFAIICPDPGKIQNPGHCVS